MSRKITSEARTWEVHQSQVNCSEEADNWIQCIPYTLLPVDARVWLCVLSYPYTVFTITPTIQRIVGVIVHNFATQGARHASPAWSFTHCVRTILQRSWSRQSADWCRIQNVCRRATRPWMSPVRRHVVLTGLGRHRQPPERHLLPISSKHC